MKQSKTCSMCLQTKNTFEYHKDKTSKDGYVQRCKLCVRKKSVEWYKKNKDRSLANSAKAYKANPEYYKAKSLEWAAENKERKAKVNRAYQIAHPEVYRQSKQRYKARKKENGLFEIGQKEMQNLYAQKCVYCGSSKDIQADHVIPIAKGGRHSIGNLVPACKSCNTSKRERTITEWRHAQRKTADQKTGRRLLSK